MVSIRPSDDETDERHILLKTIFDKSPVGLLMLDQHTVLLANPTAITLLNLQGSESGQTLRLDGPDGLLTERLLEATRVGPDTFDYRVSVPDKHEARTLRLRAVPLEAGKLLVKIDDVTVQQQVGVRWEKAVGDAFHELRTPLAVFSLGLSNLSTYYDRFTDEQRRSTIADLAEEGNAMTAILAKLFGKLQSIQRAVVDSDSKDY